MTKDKILTEKLELAGIDLITSVPQFKTGIYNAMEEYAAQQSLAFHVFTMNEMWQYNTSENTWHQYNWHSEGVSFEVVWNQFIEQQNKP